MEITRPEQLAPQCVVPPAASPFVVSYTVPGNRFGARSRPYIAHEAKPAALHLLHELYAIWPEAFAASSTHKFRETVRGDGDVYTMFMATHFVVERAREALLWTWAVGNIGGVDDAWGPEEGRRAWREVGGTFDEDLNVVDDLLVTSSHRDTLEKGTFRTRMLAHGYEPEQLTSYVFCTCPLLFLGRRS